MCRRLHKTAPFAFALLWLLAGVWAPSPLTAQDVPEPETRAAVEETAETPPGALDEAPEADEPPETPLPEAPTAPEAPEPPPRVATGERVAIFESVTIDEDEVVREVVVVGGSLTVLGRVEREAVVVGGPARIEGHVGREVTVVGSSLYLGPNSSVGRDVTVVGGTLERAETAEIGGAVNNVRLGPFFRDVDWGDVDFDWEPGFRWFGYGFSLFWHLMGLALLALLLCFAYLVAPDAVGRVEAKARTEAGKSALVGLLCLLAALPALLLLVLLTCGLGILAVPFLILAAVILWLVGYAAVSLLLGRFLERRLGWNLGSPYLLILLGFALVEIWSFLHALTDVPALWWLAVIIGLAAFVVEFVVAITSFGAAILAWAESRRRPAAPYAPAPTTPGGPPPTEPPPAEPPPSDLPTSPEPEEGFEEPGGEEPPRG